MPWGTSWEGLGGRLGRPWGHLGRPFALQGLHSKPIAPTPRPALQGLPVPVMPLPEAASTEASHENDLIEIRWAREQKPKVESKFESKAESFF